MTETPSYTSSLSLVRERPKPLESPLTRDPEVVAFLQWALPQLHMRWPGFRKVRNQVRKRLRRRLKVLGLQDLGAYQTYLKATPEEWTRLDGMCRITISRFYRDRGVFQRIDELLSEVALRGQGPVRVWSAGCAGGEEAYTVSVLWQQHHADAGPSLEIIGTDAEPAQLKRAERGEYLMGATNDLPRELRTAAFEFVGGDLLRLRDAYRNDVTFLLQDIREEHPPGPFDLILCRNLVFTYFDADLQLSVGRTLLEQLRPGGFLVLGKGEILPEGLPAQTVDGPLGIYRK